MEKNLLGQDNDKIRKHLLHWFTVNQRVLPWRGSRDPYRIWISEIIMQQTRVVQGTPYYLRFIEKFPTVGSLAAAPEQEVLKLWQGLGYYSRARNLHKAAQQVISKHEGSFPADYNTLLLLKGVGPYTAAAIASISFGLPEAVLDGNVYRVLARIYGIDTPVNAGGADRLFRKLAQELLDKKEPGKFNEAMMELGALVCIPQNPQCGECPVNKYCQAIEKGLQQKLPVKLPPPEVKDRYFHYLLIREGKRFYMKKRQAGDIWHGLYDLPLIENNSGRLLTEKDLYPFAASGESILKPVKSIRHKLTHQRLNIIFYEVQTTNFRGYKSDGMVISSKGTLDQYPLPKPIEIFLNDYLCNQEFN